MDNSSKKLQFKNANRGPVVSLFSSIEGQILNSGKPAAGIKVERAYNFGWIDKDYTESTTTDAQGKYTFKEAKKWMFLGSLLPHEPVIPQKITIFPEADNEGIEIWHHVKRNYDTMGELDGLQPYIENTAREKLTPVMQGFIEGKLRLTCDLATLQPISLDDFKFQAVDSYTRVISASDLQLPYQVAIDQTKRLVTTHKQNIETALHTYLVANTSALEALQEERLSAYNNLTYVSLESLDLYDRIELINFDFHQTEKTVELGGEIIMQMKNSNDEIVRIRVWLSDAHFQIDQQNVVFLANYNALVFNEFNIDAEGEA